MLTELAGDGECRLALFHTIRNVLTNEIYHFSRLSHQTGLIFTWAALSIESAPYLATSACSGRLFCKKLKVWVLKFKGHFSQNVVFMGCNIFSFSFGYLFEFRLNLVNF